jgi:hypothetical protein
MLVVNRWKCGEKEIGLPLSLFLFLKLTAAVAPPPFHMEM